MRTIIKLYLIVNNFFKRKKISISQQAINLIVQRAREVMQLIMNLRKKKAELEVKKIEIEDI